MSSATHVEPPDTDMMKNIQDKNVRTGKNARADLFTKSNRCPDCGGTNFITDEDVGEIICRKCGMVIDINPLDRGPEWRAFTLEEKLRKSRMGLPISPLYTDMGTTFKPMDKGMTPQQRREFGRLKRKNVRAKYDETHARNLASAISELDRLSSMLNIPKPIKEKAAWIYEMSLKKGLVRGRSIDGIITASLYAAYRTDNEKVRTLKEIAEVSPINKKDIARCYRLILKKKVLEGLGIEVSVPKAEYHIPKIASKLKISREIELVANGILRRAREYKITAGKDPIGMAAAALYIACEGSNEKRTQGQLAKAAGVTEVTIRNRYKELGKKLKEDISEILEEYNM